MVIHYDNLEKLLSALENSQKETLGYFNLPESELEKQYAPGKWTVKQLLHHLADAETVLYERIRRAIAAPNQVIWNFDQDAWCEKLDYVNVPLEMNKPLFESTRNMVIYYAKKYYKSLGGNEFVHSSTGKRTLKDEFEKVAWHNEHHLEQIRQALRK